MLKNVLKKYKTIQYAICAVLFLLLMFGLNELFRFLSVDDVKSYSRLMIHELYTQEDNIDVLFLGTSHCYRSLNPSITDDFFEANTFNAGTSLQGLDGTYTLLKEAGRYHDLKQVYVELYFGVAAEKFYDRVAQNATYLISDYMRPSINKYSYIVKSGHLGHLSNGIVLAHRDWENLFDFPYVTDLLQKKLSPAYRDYQYDYVTEITDAYKGKGYVESTIRMGTDGNFEPSDEFYFKNNYLSEDCKNCLIDIINYCKKNDIKLTFFAAPMADYYIATTHNYDNYVSQIYDFLAPYDIAYYDFNLCKQEYLNLTPDDFMDSHHLNKDGAAKFSQLFSELMLGKQNDNIFHASFVNRILEENKLVLGYIIEQVNPERTDNSNKQYDFDNYKYYILAPLSATPHEYEFYISKCVNDEDYLIQDWSSNTGFCHSNTEHGVIEIDTRIKGSTEIIDSTRMEY